MPLPLVPTIAQKIRETTSNSVTGLASGTIAEALRLKNGSEGMTVATSLEEHQSDSVPTTPYTPPGGGSKE